MSTTSQAELQARRTIREIMSRLNQAQREAVIKFIVEQYGLGEVRATWPPKCWEPKLR